MSFGTLIGFLGGVILFIGSIMLATDNLALFISLPSFIMVVGGTLANAHICYQAVYVNKSLVEALKIFNHPKIDQNVLIEDINKSLEWQTLCSSKAPQDSKIILKIVKTTSSPLELMLF